MVKQFIYGATFSLNSLPAENAGTLVVSGDQIQTLDTDIGTLLTVIISKPLNPDIGGNIVKLSFLLPIINLAIGKKETSLLTEAILTTQKTSGFIRTPLFGQLQSYQTLALRGTARYH